MKLYSTTMKLAVAILIAATALSSCKKETITPPSNNNNNNTTVDNTAMITNGSLKIINTEVSEMINAVTVVASSSRSHKTNEVLSMLSSCSTVTWDSSSAVKTVTIDFGSGCVSDDGKTRAGQLVITYDSSNIQSPGSTFTVNLNNYSIDGQAYTGSMNVHNDGYNASSHLTFAVLLTGETGETSQLNPQPTMVTTHGALEVEFYAGASTSTHDDDILWFTGNYTGSINTSETFSATITSPLILSCDPSCIKYFNQGKLTITPSASSVEYIDFGSGNCDNKGSQTVDGNTSTIYFQ